MKIMLLKQIGQAAYLPYWYLKSCVLGQHTPLQTVLFITDYCNLNCRHCAESGHAGTIMKPFDQIMKELRFSYRKGSRFVDFEGGEPTLWKDGSLTLNDLYDAAHAMGFYSCTLTTNGQSDFSDTHADSVWVSVDGYGRVHDRIRGKGTFARLDHNIRLCRKSAVSINMAINRLNKDSVADTVRYAKKNPSIKSISLNFHTPFPGTESLMLSWEERCDVIDMIIAMKKKNYPIMNSYSGLRAMKKRNFKKYCWISNFILQDGKKLRTCPGRMFNLCDECGFGMAGEMYSLMHLNPDTVLSGMKLRL